jgi:hypothetical protein
MPPENTDTTDDAVKIDAQKTGDATGTEGGKTERTFTQSELDAIVKDRLERAERKAEDDRKKGEAAAEAARLAENSQYKELSEKQALEIVSLREQIEQLDTLTTERDRYMTALLEVAKREREGLPDPVVELLDRMDVSEQLDWIAKNRESLVGSNKPNRLQPLPRANGNLSRDELLAQEIEAQRRRR